MSVNLAKYRGEAVKFCKNLATSSGVKNEPQNRNQIFLRCSKIIACHLVFLVVIITAFFVKLPTLVFANQVQVYEFSYTGDYQTFTVPQSGMYRLEAWGASGSSVPYSTGAALGGKGAYTTGDITLQQGQEIYVYVGQNLQITPLNTNDSLTSNNAFSGGGKGANDNYNGRIDKAGPGGGATDFRLKRDIWSADTSLTSRIMVAAAGGGAEAAYDGVQFSIAGGSGGELIGILGCHAEANELYPSESCENISSFGEVAATQTIGGGTFGIGANGGARLNNNRFFGGGGGGGYYGGAAGGFDYGGRNSGSGGSSYISGYLGSVAVTSNTNTTPRLSSDEVTVCQDGTTDPVCSQHYSGMVFTNTKMISGKLTMPNPAGGEMIGNTGNGFARITYLPPNQDPTCDSENADPLICGKVPDLSEQLSDYEIADTGVGALIVCHYLLILVLIGGACCFLAYRKKFGSEM